MHPLDRTTSGRKQSQKRSTFHRDDDDDKLHHPNPSPGQQSQKIYLSILENLRFLPNINPKMTASQICNLLQTN